MALSAGSYVRPLGPEADLGEGDDQRDEARIEVILLLKKVVRIDVTGEQLARLRREVLCNQQLSPEQRRRVLRKTLPIPADGSRVHLYCDGNFVAAI